MSTIAKTGKPLYNIPHSVPNYHVNLDPSMVGTEADGEGEGCSELGGCKSRLLRPLTANSHRRGSHPERRLQQTVAADGVRTREYRGRSSWATIFRRRCEKKRS